LVDPIFGAEMGGLGWDIVVNQPDLLTAKIGIDQARDEGLLSH